MLTLEIIFWVFVFIVIYSYVGYGILITLMAKIPFLIKIFPKPGNSIKEEYITLDDASYKPTVSLIISASGETKEIIREKIINTLELNYPYEKLEVIFAIAFDQKDNKDETVEEYYRTFLNGNVELNLTGKEEEVYARFLEFENASGIRDFRVLNSLEEALSDINITSDDIREGTKQKIDNHLNGNSRLSKLKVLVTKDIERKGKISQVNRTVAIASGEIIVFSDANSMFNKDSIKNLARHFRNKQVGCVAGEKRVKKSIDSTSGEGEGLYWKYESYLKKIDSKIWTTVGAAGEIYAIRKSLWGIGIEHNAIIEDFVLSMRIAQNGYRVIYEPDAYAEEDPTKDMRSEFIRRRRIAAGGFQSIVWLKELLNPFKYGVLTFQYVSHRVLRWAVVPFLLPLLMIINAVILSFSFSPFYLALIIMQLLIYFISLVGFLLEKRKIKIKIFYLPYVIVTMNIAAYVGLKRYLKGQQNVIWERVAR